MQEIKAELQDKNIMKKNDKSIKPLLVENLLPIQSELDEIVHRY